MSRRAGQLARAGLVALALVAAGCGSSGPRATLGDAIGRIGQIRAGDLSARFTMAPESHPATNAVSVIMQGSFALDRRLPLPVIHMAYTQVAGAQTKSTRIDSNGRSATILRDGTSIALGQQQQQALAATLQGPHGLGSLPLHIDQWVVHLHQRPGPNLGGQPTEQVIGNVNLPQVLSDLSALTQGRINQTTGTSSANGALQKTLRSSAFVADIGRDDHLLRRLYLRVNLVPPAFSKTGQTTQGLTLTLDLAINPRPLSH